MTIRTGYLGLPTIIWYHLFLHLRRPLHRLDPLKKRVSNVFPAIALTAPCLN